MAVPGEPTPNRTRSRRQERHPFAALLGEPTRSHPRAARMLGALIVLVGTAACAPGGVAARGAASPDEPASAARIPAARPLPLLRWGPVVAAATTSARPRWFDIVRQRVHVAYDDSAHVLRGVTALRLVPRGDTALAAVVLDAGRLRIRAVRDERGDSLRFVLGGDTLAITMAATSRGTRELRIDYDIERPSAAIAQADDASAYWTHATSPRDWVPTLDDPAARSTWELTVRALPDEIVRASGRLASRTKVRGAVEWRFVVATPVPARRIGFVVGRLAVASDTSARPVLALWSTARPSADTRRALAALRRMQATLAERPGDAADGIDELVALPDGAPDEWHGVGLTTVRDDAAIVPAWAVQQLDPDARLARAALAPSLARRETDRSSVDAWVGEALATLLGWELASATPEERAWRRLTAMADALAAERRERMPLAASSGAASGARGAIVLGMLRDLVGDSAVRAGTRRHVAGDTSAVERRVAEAARRDLSAFFSQWVRGTGYPAFSVRWFYDSAARRLALVVRQTQPRDSATGRFDAAVDLEAHFTDGSRARRWRLDVSADSASFTFDSVPPIRWLTWDAGDRLLDETDLPRSTLMLAEQLRWDADLAGRRSALLALAERMGEPLAVRAVEHALRADMFWGIRRLAIPPLARLRGDTLARNALLDATNDPDARVRDAAVGALAEFPGELTVARLRIVALSDASLLVRAAALDAYAALDPRRALPDLRDALARDSWHDVLRVGALAALAHVDSAAAWELARAQLAADVSPRARRAAISALLAHRAGRDADLALLLDPLLQAREPSVRAAAADALGLLRVPGLAGALEARREVEHDVTVLDAIARALHALGEAGVSSR
jgi:aminopeptidase N